MARKQVDFIKEEISGGERRVTQVVTTPAYPRKYILNPRFDGPDDGCLAHFKDWSREELIAHLLNAGRLLEQATTDAQFAKERREAFFKEEQRKAAETVAEEQGKRLAAQAVLAKRDAAIVALVLKLTGN